MNSKTKGVLYILLAAVSFSLMTVCVRLAGDLPATQKALFRNLVAFFVIYIPMRRKGKKLEINKDNIKDLLGRSIFGIIGVVGNFYAIDHLLLTDANMLNKLSPFAALIFSYFMLKEKGSIFDWSMTILAFIGALFVIKPGFCMDLFPGLMGLMGGVCAGLAYTFVRRMGIHGVPSETIVLFFSGFSILSMLPFTIANYQPMSLWQLLCFVGVGVFGAGGQIGITKAYTFAPAKEISVYDYTQVIFAAFWGWMIFGQIPDIYSFIGYAIIISAGIARFMKNRRS